MLCHRPRHHDEVLLPADPKIRHSHRCVTKHHYGGWNRYVRCLPHHRGRKTKFVCVDGPEFDGHQVEWDEMFKRMGSFKDVEREEMAHLAASVCHAVPEDHAGKETPAQEENTPQAQAPMEELLDRKAPWREALRKSMKPKERTAISRCPMNELDPVYRATTRTEEVNTGYTKEQAMTEAKRCLDCANPTCMQGCPVSINIPSFIKNVERGAFLEAARVLKQTSSLPAVCGRVCPQENNARVSVSI